jgi:hypothetical protein
MEPGTRFLSTPNAAAYLAVKYGHGSAKTLDTLRCRGGGPAFRRIGAFRCLRDDGARRMGRCSAEQASEFNLGSG